MRAVALDLGTRRIGVAVSDAGGTMATPYSVITRSGDSRADRAKVAEIVSEVGAGLVVVGLPLITLTCANLRDQVGLPSVLLLYLVLAMVVALVGGVLPAGVAVLGGFLLAKPATSITLAEIIEAIEGPIAMTKCVQGHVEECQLHGSCRTKPHLQAANAAVRGALDRVSLATLSGQMQ